MRFLEHQKKARRLSGVLLLFYMLSVVAVSVLAAVLTAWVSSIGISISADNSRSRYETVFILSFLLTGVVVAGCSWFRMRRLAKGGKVVAEALGGQRLRRHEADLGGQRLLNVVEEMAVASAMPVPAVYILPEKSINAFAAGMTPADAVIGITYGAVRMLNRNELQALIAHEFSHIVNGDMRSNMQLSGWLFGLQAISVAGRLLTFGDTQESFWGSANLVLNNKQDDIRLLPTAVLGIPLQILGWFGSWLAGLIQAAISRQREFLADASAVQFTRQTEGLASALYKAATAEDTRFHAVHAAEYAHFMFCSIDGRRRFWADWLATHPDVVERIRRISEYRARRWENAIRRAEENAAVVVFDVESGISGFAPVAYSEQAGSRERHYLLQAVRAADADYDVRQQRWADFPGAERWQSAAGDAERLLVAFAVLWLPDGIADETLSLWERHYPVRAAWYRRLRQNQLHGQVRLAIFEQLLPSLAWLSVQEKQVLQQELMRVLQGRVLSPSESWQWLMVCAYTANSESLLSIETAGIRAENILEKVEAWAAGGGSLAAPLLDKLPDVLQTAAAWQPGQRHKLYEACRYALAGQSDEEWRRGAEAALGLYLLDKGA
ncbi:M48 family metalloprotease [Neisseria sp. S1]|uniref:M48 family metalloprotease n=1 Tax=Neisseria sp. S1 TaxID=3318354 RepID=UPI003A8A44B0